MKRGILIAFEGNDGSGKTVQARHLKNALRKFKHNVLSLAFPQRNRPSGYFAKRYMTGAYGSWEQANPYVISAMYALDRIDRAREIAEHIQKGGIVVTDRYAASNMAHQGSKIRNTKKRQAFFDWIYNFEYTKGKLPKPNITFFLKMPLKTASQLIAKRKGLPDIHEKNKRHLNATDKTYHEILSRFPKEFVTIECVSDRKLRTVNDIHKEILSIVQKLV